MIDLVTDGARIMVRSHASIGLARGSFGWYPRVSFDEGPRRTVEWYRS